jgi:hypothetical protein
MPRIPWEPASEPPRPKPGLPPPPRWPRGATMPAVPPPDGLSRRSRSAAPSPSPHRRRTTVNGSRHAHDVPGRAQRQPAEQSLWQLNGTPRRVSPWNKGQSASRHRMTRRGVASALRARTRVTGSPAALTSSPRRAAW